jgi:hypothetical protein
VVAAHEGALEKLRPIQQFPPRDVATELERAKRELAEVKQARNVLKKRPGTSPRKSAAKVPAARYALMKDLRRDYSIVVMCRVLAVLPSGFHAGLKRPPSRRARDETRLRADILAAHRRTRENCGPGRLRCELADQGVTVGVPRIKRIRR